MADLVHVVSKRNNANHAVCCQHEGPAPGAEVAPLPAMSIRVRSQLISLTSNNLGYARGGSVPGLNWWDAYPTPQSLPAPFNNSDEWGIVPAWGYGVVTESTIDAIGPGTLLFGFWPASAHTVVLQLQPSEPPGYWQETSQHRHRLLAIYNRYRQVVAEDAQTMAMKTLFLGTAGFLLNHFVFSPHCIHPLGLGAPWSDEDASLASAVVISLSASSKTGRSFAWEVARDRDTATQGPMALLQLTSVPESVPRHPEALLPIKSASYGEIKQGVVDWVAGFQPSRVVIVDFGAAEDVTESLIGALADADLGGSVSIIAVGSEAKVYSSAEVLRRMARNKELGKVQLNTGALLNRALEVETPAIFAHKLDDAWSRCYREGGFGSIEVKMLRGVGGSEGIEGAWSDLCNRKVAADVGLVVQLQGV
ncbi:hypothetical protein B0T16DRAFT_392785 [Cercophora newfieldiana]|uniref:Uncharacterized protein n=1 Tax=Cercophora newfieldiana TaxID=92897 RepID=A0AA39Y4M8_9PEZI|nr:hypothetical protein B0T16DRAFT_392785 [Cercophora newfieldiana]